VQELSFKVADASGGQPAIVNGKIEPFVVPCDDEAGEPLDLQGVSPGKLPNEINTDTAIAACSDAVAKFPDVPRYKYELGRAKLAAKDTQGALELFQAAADAGHVRAYNQMGYMTQYGFGRSQSMTEANQYYKMAADQGDPYGMLSYGRTLVYGRGMEKDLQEGTRLLNKSVELGHTFAMNELGAMYFYGRNVKLNPQRGLRFWEAGLARNDIYSIRNIGLAYLNGKGVKKDNETALAMFKRASDGGHPNAATDIGAMYYNGTGVKKDIAQAINWYETGAERGDAWSASNLAYIFSKGPNGLRDFEKAVRYASLSVALDRKNEISKGREVLKSMPAEAKRKVIKTLIAEVGASIAAIKDDLDGTLVSLSTQAWQARNPRYDLL
jgi:TPR repeat protein